MSTIASTRPSYADWLATHLPHGNFTMHPLAGDASFRRYIRVKIADTSYMLMDAPTDTEDCTPFVTILRQLNMAGVRVPHIEIEDLAQGYLLLEDFGDTLLSTVLKADNVDALYTQALTELIPLQHADKNIEQLYDFPLYDHSRLAGEMALFNEWFVPKLLNLQPDSATQTLIHNTFDTVLAACLEQPTVVVHRDYHCRNLMLIEGAQANSAYIGIIDFQDAVIGPITYDAASLLRDAYVCWQPAQVNQWVATYLTVLQQHGQLVDVSLATFTHWFNMMAIQRHLKILGIFVRLNLRDGKANYMNDLPLVLAYLLAECKALPQLNDFSQWLTQTVLPAYLHAMPTHRNKLVDYLQVLDPSIQCP